MFKNQGRCKVNKGEKNVLLLGITSLLNDVSSEMISAVLPLFISQLGGGGVAIGVVGGLRELLSNLLKPLSGYLSDSFLRKKPLVFLGYAVSSFFKLLIGLSKNVEQVVFSSVLERVGKGIRTAPRDSIISLSGKSGKSFGIHRTMDTAGALIGVILVLFLASLKVENREIIVSAGFISFLSLLPILMVKEPEVLNRKTSETLVKKRFDRKFFKLLSVFAIYSFGSVSFMFLIFIAEKETSSLTAVTLYALLNLSYLLVSFPAGELSDRVGRRFPLSAGYFLTALSLFTLSLHSGIVLLTASFLLYGLALGITDTVQRALTADIVGREKRGTAYGLFHGVTGVGALLGNLLAGYLWNLYGNASFALFGIFCVIATILVSRYN